MKDGEFHRAPPLQGGRAVRTGAPATVTRWAA
jgi:hypothetical protein